MSTHIMKIHRVIECLLSSGRSQPEMTMSVSFWKRQNYGDSKKKKKAKWLPEVKEDRRND